MGNSEFQILPALPLKNTILFPGLLLPLSVGRDSSLNAVEAALKTEEKEIVLVAQRDPHVDSPGAKGSPQTPQYRNGESATVRLSRRSS